MVSNLSAGAEQQSPFDQFRARSLLTWPLLTFLVIGVVTVSVTGNTVSDLGNNTILAFEIEAVYALWIIWQCRRHCISIPQLFGPMPRNPRTWIYIALAVPLVALSTVTVWLRVRVSHFLLPQLGTSFTNWLAYRPQFGHAADVWTVCSPGPYIGSCCRGITVPRFALPPLGAEVGGDARNACFIVCLQPDAQGHAWDLRLRTGNGVALHANTQPDDPDCLSCPRYRLGFCDPKPTRSKHLVEPLAVSSGRIARLAVVSARPLARTKFLPPLLLRNRN